MFACIVCVLVGSAVTK